MTDLIYWMSWFHIGVGVGRESWGWVIWGFVIGFAAVGMEALDRR